MTVTTTSHPQLTVGQVADEAGVSRSAVRHYDKYGVIPATRTSTNQRRFAGAAPCRIKVTLMAQRVGLTLAEIAEILADLPDDPQPTDWAMVSERLVSEAERRVAELRHAVATIEGGSKLCDAVDHAAVS